MDSSALRDSLEMFYDSIVVWIRKREDNVGAIGRIADDISTKGKTTNTVKMIGAGLSAVAGAAAVVGTGGMAAPFMMAAGVGGAFASGAAEITKACKFPKLLDEAQQKLTTEINEYKRVVANLSRIPTDEIIIIRRTLEVDSQLSVRTAAENTAYNAAPHVSELGISTAGALITGAIASAENVAIGMTPYIATKAFEASQLVNAFKSTLQGLTGMATAPARQAPLMLRTTFLTSFDDPVKTFLTKGLPSVAEHQTRFAKLTAEATAKSALEKSIETTVKTTSEAGKSSVKSFLGTATKALPYVNAACAVYDGYQTYKAGKELADGTDEEKQLRQRIKELKKEANTIVQIYNSFTRNRTLELRHPLIGIPFCEELIEYFNGSSQCVTHVWTIVWVEETHEACARGTHIPQLRLGEDEDEITRIQPQAFQKVSGPYYPMISSRHGVALIINNKEFDDLSVRTGTHRDEMNLTETWLYLGYHVEVKCNYRYDQVMNIFNDIDSFLGDSNRNAEAKGKMTVNNDSFVCCILSHGNSEGITCSDRKTLTVKEIECAISKSRILKSKPKLFFLQACRGESPGTELVHADNNEQAGDFSYTFATSPGNVAYRNELKGTWFIREVCKVLCQFATSCNLQELQQKIKQAVKNNPEYRATNNGRQYMQEVSWDNRTLTKYVHFFDGESEAPGNKRASSPEAPASKRRKRN